MWAISIWFVAERVVMIAVRSAGLNGKPYGPFQVELEFETPSSGLSRQVEPDFRNVKFRVVRCQVTEAKEFQLPVT